MEYSLPWDRTTLAWTLGTACLLLGLASMSLISYRHALRAGVSGSPQLVSALICVVSLLGVLAVAPFGLRLQDSILEVRRPIGALHYDLGQVTSVEVVPYETVFTPGTWRSFGVGGPFGLIGRFRSPAIGPFRAAVTRRADLVLLRFKEAPPLVLSPASPADLAAALTRARAAVRNTSGV
jgi:hypothetical protein